MSYTEQVKNASEVTILTEDDEMVSGTPEHYSYVDMQTAIDGYFTNKSKLTTNILPVDSVRDFEWVKESMGVDTVDLDITGDILRFLSSADRKYEDSSLGGAFVMNPKPQFCRYTDPRAKGIYINRNDTTLGNITGNLGMGHYYSEAIADTQQTIHMRFGVASFNSMLSYFTSFYDYGAARYANTGGLAGSINDLAYHIGKTVGFVLNIKFWPLLLAHSVGLVMTFFLKSPASKYYYLSPRMSSYWTAVSSMVNQIAVHKRFFPYEEASKDYPREGGGRIDKEQWDMLLRLLPGILHKDGFIDVYAIASKTQSMRNQAQLWIDEQAKNLDTYEEFRNWSMGIYSGATLPAFQKAKGLRYNVEMWLRNTIGNQSDEIAGGKEKAGAMSIHERTVMTPTEAGEVNGDINNRVFGEDHWGSWKDYFNAEFKDGTQFATFRVDNTGSVDESFSNSTGESAVQRKFNDVSANARSIHFSLSGGNVAPGIGQALDAVMALVGGMAEELHIGGLVALAGSAFADIPDQWTNSAANLPRMSYTMQLVAPYGNPVSQLINIDIPLCMILAGALPISRGRQAYGPPFLVELHDQGKAMTRLGIIDSLTVTRGTTNLGFNKEKKAMSVDISFSIKDLSSIMHMPLETGFSFSLFKGVFDDDTVYNDYLSTLAAATLGQNIYLWGKLKRNLISKYRGFRVHYTSPARWMGILHDSPVGVLDAFFHETERK